MSKHLRIAALALAVSAGLLAPSSAHAERWASSDTVSDVEAWHYEPEPTPCGTYVDADGTANTNNDITRLVVRHTRKDIRLILRFRDLEATLEQHASLHLATARGGWFLDVDRSRNRSGKWRVTGLLGREPDFPDPEEIEDECGVVFIDILVSRCGPKPQVDTDADEIRASVPRSCLGNPRWVKAGASSYGHTEPEDPADPSFGGFSDDWGTRDPAASPWLPPFGPRVRTGVHALVGGPAAATRGSRRLVMIPGLG